VGLRQSADRDIDKSAGRDIDNSAGRDIDKNAGRDIDKSAGRDIDKNAGRDIDKSAGRDIDSKLTDRLKQMVISTGTPTLISLLKTYMLHTGLGLKLGLHREGMEPWQSVLNVKLVNTFEVWHREMTTKLGKKFAV